MPINEVAAGVRSGTIKTITVEENQLSFQGPEGQRYTARKEPNTTISKLLMDYGVSSEQLSHVGIVVQQPSEMSNWAPALLSLLPLLAFGALMLFMLRRSQSGNNDVLSFGKSRARMATIDKPTVTFADAAGVDEADAGAAGGRRVPEVPREVRRPGRPDSPGGAARRSAGHGEDAARAGRGR